MKKFLAFTWMAILFISLPVKAQTKAEIDTLVKFAFEKIKGKDYYAAVREFNRILRISPSHADALTGRAIARYNIGDRDEAMIDITEADRISPDNPDVLKVRADIYFEQKKYREAEEDYSRALILREGWMEAFRGKVLAMNMGGKEKEALALVESGIKKNPEESMYYYLRGLLSSLKGKFSKALEDYDKALSLQPGNNLLNCYLNRGIAYMSIEEYESALEDLNRVMNEDPSNQVALQSRGRTYYNLKMYEGAIEDFSKAIELSPSNDALYYNLAMAYFRQENKTAACENFHKSCSMGNNNACRMVLMECSTEIK